MTIYDWIRQKLETLAITAAYPVVADSDAIAPYAVSQRVGGLPMGFLGDDLPSLKNGRFQVAIWAQTALEAEQLSVLAENVLVSDEELQIEALGQPVDDYDEETHLYGSRQDFSIWSPR